MRAASVFRSSLIALRTLIGTAIEFPAYADSGSISLTVLKAGFVIGGSAGSGSLFFTAGDTARHRRPQLWVHVRRFRDTLPRRREPYPRSI
jgi:hypothetical protein